MGALFFLTSGLFLGWSLGANDAANVFGTAVGSRILSFRRAALLCSVFIILGAVSGGGGAAHSLGALGNVSTLEGAFTAALSAAISAAAMTRAGLPVSSSQAIVGSIIGWNWYNHLPTHPEILRKFLLTWVLCPVLAAGIAICLYFLVRFWVSRVHRSIFKRDRTNRIVLVLAGIFGAYALGANNIANVMGVFIYSLSPPDLSLGPFLFSGAQQLFFVGALAIALGVVTYSRRTMMTIGSRLFQLSPPAAAIAVISHSMVLFLFSSKGLQNLLIRWNLPTLPLIPVSSSQAIVGAVFGIALAKGGRNLRWDILGKIAAGWVVTPLSAMLICYFSLFFVQNVFRAVL